MTWPCWRRGGAWSGGTLRGGEDGQPRVSENEPQEARAAESPDSKKPGLRPRCAAGVNPVEASTQPSRPPARPHPGADDLHDFYPPAAAGRAARPVQGLGPLRTASMFTAVNEREGSTGTGRADEP